MSYATSYGETPSITLVGKDLHFSLVNQTQGRIELKFLKLEDEGLGGEIILHLEKSSNCIALLVIPSYKNRICWERSGAVYFFADLRTQIRYSSQKDMLYFSFCPTNRQEYSLELELYDDKIIFDVRIASSSLLIASLMKMTKSSGSVSWT